MPALHRKIPDQLRQPGNGSDPVGIKSEPGDPVHAITPGDFPDDTDAVAGGIEHHHVAGARVEDGQCRMVAAAAGCGHRQRGRGGGAEPVPAEPQGHAGPRRQPPMDVFQPERESEQRTVEKNAPPAWNQEAVAAGPELRCRLKSVDIVEQEPAWRIPEHIAPRQQAFEQGQQKQRRQDRQQQQIDQECRREKILLVIQAQRRAAERCRQSDEGPRRQPAPPAQQSPPPRRRIALPFDAAAGGAGDLLRRFDGQNQEPRNHKAVLEAGVEQKGRIPQQQPGADSGQNFQRAHLTEARAQHPDQQDQQKSPDRRGVAAGDQHIKHQRQQQSGSPVQRGRAQQQQQQHGENADMQPADAEQMGGAAFPEPFAGFRRHPGAHAEGQDAEQCALFGIGDSGIDFLQQDGPHPGQEIRFGGRQSPV
ncbi:hypothetical protein SDC9_82989 [bioreactor metagenome]|uniref:Uncharacterized protein n=1 Tax=bioreactor metagenome TaxID=1076179 RepID=A0A644ZCE9_9ZZZZ